MAISVTIQTTARQDTLLGRALDLENAQRVGDGKEPYADVNAMARAQLIEQLRGWARMMETREVETVSDAYRDATDAERNAARTALGLDPL